MHIIVVYAGIVLRNIKHYCLDINLMLNFGLGFFKKQEPTGITSLIFSVVNVYDSMITSVFILIVAPSVTKITK